MAEKIISNEEIKLITGLSGPDGKIEIFNNVMTSVLATMLNLKQFGRFTVQDEEVQIIENGEFWVNSFPVTPDSISLYRSRFQKNVVNDYNYRADDYDFRKFILLNDQNDQAYLSNCTFFASYQAGFLLNATLEVTNNDLVGTTLSVTQNGETTVYNFIASGTPEDDEILIGVDVEATMNNIAVKLEATGADGVVKMPLGVTLSTSEVTQDKLVYENPDEMLDELKLAVAYLVAGAISDKVQIEGVNRYRMGSKEVSFRDMTEKDFTASIINKYLTKFKKVIILS